MGYLLCNAAGNIDVFNCENALQYNNSHKCRRHQAERDLHFYFPICIARLLLGANRYAIMPTFGLVDEILFAGKKKLHKSAMKHFIYSGDLTAYLRPVANCATGAEITQLLEADLNFRNTEAYKVRVSWFEQSIEQKLHARCLQSRNDIDEYFEYQVSLIRSIDKHGYHSQHDLARRQNALVPEFSSKRPREHEIGCAIGPNGEVWMFRTGHHRLQIARALGVEQIPVEVHFIHWKWLARCCKEYRLSPFTDVTMAIQTRFDGLTIRPGTSGGWP